jgi:hypothetical protein
MATLMAKLRSGDTTNRAVRHNTALSYSPSVQQGCLVSMLKGWSEYSPAWTVRVVAKMPSDSVVQGLLVRFAR